MTNTPVTTCDYSDHDHTSLQESVDCAAEARFDEAAEAAEARDKADHDNRDCSRDPSCCSHCEAEWDAEMDRRFEEYRDARFAA